MEFFIALKEIHVKYVKFLIVNHVLMILEYVLNVKTNIYSRIINVFGKKIVKLVNFLKFCY